MAYSLTYFNGRGLAETIRLLFNYGGIEFEDIRIEKEEWSQHKNKALFGQLPLLEHNGKQINQSTAISRYVANIVNLTGNSEWENLEIDAIIDTLIDFRTKGCAVFYEPDEDKQKVLRENTLKEHLPYYLQRLNAVVEKNNGYLALGHLTWADIFFVVLVDLLEVGQRTSNILEKYPNLKKLQETVYNIPNIKNWVEKRPKTEW